MHAGSQQMPARAGARVLGCMHPAYHECTDEYDLPGPYHWEALSYRVTLKNYLLIPLALWKLFEGPDIFFSTSAYL